MSSVSLSFFPSPVWVGFFLSLLPPRHVDGVSLFTPLTIHIDRSIDVNCIRIINIIIDFHRRRKTASFSITSHVPEEGLKQKSTMKESLGSSLDVSSVLLPSPCMYSSFKAFLFSLDNEEKAVPSSYSDKDRTSRASYLSLSLLVVSLPPLLLLCCWRHTGPPKQFTWVLSLSRERGGGRGRTSGGGKTIGMSMDLSFRWRKRERDSSPCLQWEYSDELFVSSSSRLSSSFSSSACFDCKTVLFSSFFFFCLDLVTSEEREREREEEAAAGRGVSRVYVVLYVSTDVYRCFFKVSFIKSSRRFPLSFLSLFLLGNRPLYSEKSTVFPLFLYSRRVDEISHSAF